LDNRQKANEDLVMRNNKALKLENTLLVQCCFKALFKNAFARVLSFEVVTFIAWR